MEGLSLALILAALEPIQCTPYTEIPRLSIPLDIVSFSIIRTTPFFLMNLL